MFSQKVVNSSSYNNEDLDSDLLATNFQKYILKTTTEGWFSREQCRKIVEIKCSFNCNEDELNDLMEITGSNPLETWEFCKRKQSNFKETLEKYTNERTKIIFQEISSFYMKKVQLNEWKEEFLENFFIFLDTKSCLEHENYEQFIDRRYMFVKSNILESISPIAQKILFQFYSEKMFKYEEKNNTKLTSNYNILYKDTDEKNDPALKGFLFEKLIINQLIRKKNKEFSIVYYNFESQNNGKILMKFDSVVFFNNDLSLRHSFDEDLFLIPYKFNNPFADFYYYRKSEKILYAFQITISVENHQNSDNQFFNSSQYANLMKKGGIEKIRFVWITDKEDIKKIESQFKKVTNAPIINKKSKIPKDSQSLIVSARENIEVWNFD